MSEQEGASKPTPTAVDTAAADATTSAESGCRDDAGEVLGDKTEALTVESLGRYLAAEASLREESEQRTSTVLTRYLKLTLVMACLNMVVAAVSVTALLRHREKAQPIVVAPPVTVPVPVPATPPPAEKAPVVVEPAEPLAEPPLPPAPPPAVSPPARIPLLGPLLPPAPRHTPGATRPTRVASKPLPSPPPAPVALARNGDEDSAQQEHRSVERW